MRGTNALSSIQPRPEGYPTPVFKRLDRDMAASHNLPASIAQSDYTQSSVTQDQYLGSPMTDQVKRIDLVFAPAL